MIELSGGATASRTCVGAWAESRERWLLPVVSWAIGLGVPLTGFTPLNHASDVLDVDAHPWLVLLMPSTLLVLFAGAAASLFPARIPLPTPRWLRIGSALLLGGVVVSLFGSSDRIMSLLGRLLEILDEKSATFSKRNSTWIETATREIGAFWLTHTINSAMAPLRHIYRTRHGHPDLLYQEMLKLGGALCTFAIDSHPRSMPTYDHSKLSECFADLDYHIRSHLEIIIPTQFVAINLVKRAEYFYEAECTDQRVFNRSRWILGVRSKIGEADIIANTPKLVKICSKEFIPRLVQQALPGMALTHMSVPPSQIPAKVDAQYFSMTQAGPCWDHLSKTRKLGLYIPGEIPNPEVELLVILEQ